SCSSCQQSSPRNWCQDCFGSDMWCDTCCVSAHAHLPFHHIQTWNEQFFEKSNLLTNHLILDLYHYPDDCPSIVDVKTQMMWNLDISNEEHDVNQPSEPSASTNTSGSRSSLVIISSTGIFHQSIRWCHCTKSPAQYTQLLLCAKLFPASFKNLKTAFTCEVLNHFQVDALECKTVAMNFMSKICSGKLSELSDDISALIMQCRIAIRSYFEAGVIHDRPDISIDGRLALFCPACLQIDINIPPETEWKLEDRLLYRPQLVVDGNMKLVHLVMKHPSDDVSLSDGELFMVRHPAYVNHLKSRCNNHRAQNNGNLHRKHLDSTGKGACACARHGAFVPHCVVDFQKGERQINMDYSICQALKWVSGHDHALVIYDICCQWSIHFQECVAQLEFLELWDSLKITGAVRKWHLTAHIPECFAKFTLNFIEGAGQVKGEILETLWSGMDEVAGLAQAMSTAYHQEVLDEYMSDSNWQKIIQMGRNLYFIHYYIALTPSQADSLCGKWS
ncbi:hypothetical protein BJV78DRAFT_1140113, partial [Lactifluus subvellereus]